MEKIEIRHNNIIGIIGEPYEHKQHKNQQCGLDLYIEVLNLDTYRSNYVKLYKNSKGLHFKVNGTHYLDEFKFKGVYIPNQVILED